MLVGMALIFIHVARYLFTMIFSVDKLNIV